MLRHSGETTPHVGSLESISEMFSSSDSRTTDGQEFSHLVAGLLGSAVSDRRLIDVCSKSGLSCPDQGVGKRSVLMSIEMTSRW